MIISRKRNKPFHPELIMNNTPVAEVNTHRHLGLVFSSDSGWHTHTVTFTGKSWQCINILRSFKFRPDRKSLERMYVSFIRPVLEYSGIIWDNCNDDKQAVEKIQIEALRINVITGATKLGSIASLYQETGFETLEDRRNKQKLITFYKMSNSLSPLYFSRLMPPQVRENSRVLTQQCL